MLNKQKSLIAGMGLSFLMLLIGEVYNLVETKLFFMCCDFWCLAEYIKTTNPPPPHKEKEEKDIYDISDMD